MRALVIACLAGVAAASAQAAPRPKKAVRARPAPRTPAQRDADRHVKTGVALFNEARYAEALAEFERGYAISPHPLVLYNIAACHRALAHDSQAVGYYTRFLTEGQDQASAAQLTAAQAELDGVLARIARVSVKITPVLDGTTLTLDGAMLAVPAKPLILLPGEHRFVAHGDGRRDAEKTLTVASGDDVDVELVLGELPPAWVDKPVLGNTPMDLAEPTAPRRFSISAGFGTDLRHAREADSAAPSVGLAVAIGSRIELGVDAVLRSYAVIPSLRVRLAGDRLAVHLVGALPISITDRSMTEMYVAGGAGLGLRYRPMPGLAFRLESYAAFAGNGHRTTVPTFVRAELWF